MKLLVRLRRLAVAFQPGEKSEKEDRREADAQPSQKENYQLAGNSPNLAEAQQAMRRIIRDGNRVGDVISRMRALFKKAPAAKESVDINLVIQDVLTLSQPELQKDRVSLRTQFAVDLPIVLGDKIQLQQVILNLVVNAIEAMSGVTENQRELHVSSLARHEDFVNVALRLSDLETEHQSS